MKFLVIDDKVGRVIQRMATKLGYETDIATNGAEGLNLARQNHYDLILLDCNMPIMWGEECYRQLKADPSLKAIPVVAIGDFSDDFPPEDLPMFDGRIKKPFNFKTIEETINRINEQVPDPEDTTQTF